ncbi:MAG TPA: aldose 1-epimerase [Flavitalea sp.]|nr:aldose 1-epimerase [Flavitalea sp.]
MKFSIKDFEENGLKGIRLLNTENNSSVDVLPEHGMLLHAFRIPTKNVLLNVIDNYSDESELRREIALSYKGCKMSPFACRIPGGIYPLNGKHYELEKKFIDGSSIHGLLSDSIYKKIYTKANDSFASVSATFHYNKSDKGYPFRYRCAITYTLLPGYRLRLETVICNEDEKTIPVADGWHPYFTLGAPINSCTLRFSSNKMLEFDERLVPTGRMVPIEDFLRPEIIGERKIDNCFSLQHSDDDPCCIFQNPATNMSLLLFSDAAYPFLQIYTPDHRRSIALENLSGAPNCFNNGMGLILLEPGDSAKFAVSYEIDPGPNTR